LNQNDLAQFIADECVLDPVDRASHEQTRTLARVLFERWRQWCARKDAYEGLLVDFCAQMKGRFRYTNTDNRPAFHGLSLAEWGPEEGDDVRN
jgi:phage/plasmid-associated DNA primase